MSERLANEIRRAIRESGLTLIELARQTGVDRGLLSRFMRDERTITLRTAEPLCRRLGLDLKPKQRRRKGR